MFWADRIAKDLKDKGLQHVDDMKTPSGRIHVGALRGVVIHDLAYKALKDNGNDAVYTYVFENHDPMDALPVNLPREKFEQYLGMPLFKVPSPVEGYNNYAEYYALEFQHVFNTIGCHPAIIWTKDLYTSGKMNESIKDCLDKADIIRDIYKEIYKKDIPSDWYPFQVYCPQCGKVSTTNVYGWDKELVSFECVVDKVDWAKGCGYKGKISPYSDENGMNGKLPWKVEWPVKWKVIGVTVEGAGKDHMSKGGSHDLSSLVSQRVIDYPVPYPIAYEWFLIGGKKMSTSKGVGSSAIEMLEILPPELLRFLMVKTDINQAINFDPSGMIIPKLFDEYQEYGQHYFSNANDDYARVFELSQVGQEVKQPPKVRFSLLAQWVQMPNMTSKIQEENAEVWVKYAKIWLARYAPESERFLVQQDIPERASEISSVQKEYLKKLTGILEIATDVKMLEENIYNLGNELGLIPKDAFSAIYLSLLGKPSGPKASYLLLSLDRDFVRQRFEEVSRLENTEQSTGSSDGNIITLNRPDLFSINPELKGKYPSISVGVAVIKGVHIEHTSTELENEKEELLKALEGLTTEQLGQYKEIVSYRKLYKAMGIDWHSRRPSPEALLRRVVLKKGLYTVNTCVDAYNLVVMKNRVSVGAFELDRISFPTVLRLARDGEDILLLGDRKPTGYKNGEVAYFDQKGGYNIDFNYRDAQRTAVRMDTENVYINVDGISDITPDTVERVLKEACDKILEYCGGTVEVFGVVTGI